MKKLICMVLFLLVGAAFVFGVGQYETVGAMKDMPRSVQAQSQFGVGIAADWKEFDKSGDIRFLQVQTTAPASPAGSGSILNGSHGERIIEIQAASSIKGKEVEWKLTNKGSNPVWVLAGGLSGKSFNLRINGGASSIFKLDMDGSGYTYLVVDSEGSGKNQLDVSAKIGDTDAKTARGKSMVIIWF